MGTAIVLLVVDAVLRSQSPLPLPSRDKSINQYTSQLGLGNSLCHAHRRRLPATLASFRPHPPSRYHDTGLNHQLRIGRALHPCRHNPSIRSISSEPRTQQTHLCRSLCSQPASLPHDQYRRRPCSQLARDRTTAHLAPTLRKPVLSTSKLAAHWLIQHPQVSITLSYVHTYPNACSWRVQWRLHDDAN